MRSSWTLRCLGVVLASGACFAGLSSTLDAQVLQKDQILDNQSSGYYATSVGIGGQAGERKLVVIGSPWAAGGAGFVQLFEYSDELLGWTGVRNFDPGPQAGSFYGLHCAVHRAGHKRNDIVAIANPNDDAAGGNVFVYKRGSIGLWPERTIQAIDHGGFPGDYFGASIALDYPLLLVGATSANAQAGAAYLFVHISSSDTWQLVQYFDGAMGGDDRFGCSVALCGGNALDSRIAIGAYDADGSSLQDSGLVYVYRKTANGWEDERVLVSSQPAVDARFGSSVSLYKDALGAVLVVGEPGSSNGGAAHVFRSANDSPDYVHEQLLQPAGSTGGFGTHVDTNGRYAAIGGSTGVLGGTVFLYENDQAAPGTWTLVQENVSPNRVGYFTGEVALLDHGPGDDPETVMAVSGDRDGGGVKMFVPTELQMSVTPEFASVGDTVTMEVAGGKPSGRLMIVAWEIDNVPYFYNIFGLQGFDGGGVWSFSTALPSLPLGTELEFRTFGQVPSGKMGLSNRGHLTID